MSQKIPEIRKSHKLGGRRGFQPPHKAFGAPRASAPGLFFHKHIRFFPQPAGAYRHRLARQRREPFFLSSRSEEPRIPGYPSDDRRRNGEKWPRPFGFHPSTQRPRAGGPGCGANPAILRSRPRRWTATAFGLGLASTPRTKTSPWGPRIWRDLRSQRCASVYVDTP